MEALPSKCSGTAPAVMLSRHVSRSTVVAWEISPDACACGPLLGGSQRAVGPITIQHVRKSSRILDSRKTSAGESATPRHGGSPKCVFRLSITSQLPVTRITPLSRLAADGSMNHNGGFTTPSSPLQGTPTMPRITLMLSLCLLPLIAGCGSQEAPKKEAWQKREQVYTDKTPEEWVELIRHSNYQARSKAIDALVQYAKDGEDTLPALIDILRDKTAGQGRLAVARALGAMGSKAKSAVPALAEALADTSWDARDAAARALADIGANPEVAIPALIGAINDADVRVRGEAARGIGRYGSGDAKAIDALIEALGDESATVKARATDALQRIGPKAKAAIPALEEAAKSPDIFGADAAKRALESIRGN